MEKKICIICFQEFIPSIPQNTRCPTCRHKLTTNQKQKATQNMRAYRFKKRTGKSLSEYNDLYCQQDGKCKLCNQLQTELHFFENKLLCSKCINLFSLIDTDTELVLKILRIRKIV